MGSGIFSLGTSALMANQAMMDTTSHNIANVNTPGYSRQQVELSTQDGLYTGAGFYGRGVKVVTITRTTNEFLVKESNLYTAQSASDTTRLDKLKQLENVLPTGEAGLGYAANQVLNAFSDVANAPADTSARQVVLSRAQDFVSRVNTAANQLTELQSGVVSDVGVAVEEINQLTAKIAKVNDNIAKYQGSGHTPNDLLDQRDQLVKQLNAQVQVSTVNADDGTVNVFMGGGQLLVLGSQVQTLKAVHDPDNSAQVRVALDTNGSARILDSSQVTGGALKGLLDFQDSDLASVRTQLNNFTQTFTDALNKQQALGINANGDLQTSFDTSGNPVSHNLFNNTSDAAALQLNLTAAADVAAASPLTAATPNTNAGTLQVGSLIMSRALPTTNAPDFGSSLPVQGNALSVVFETNPANNGSMFYRFVDQNGNAYNDTTPARIWNDPTDTSTRVISDAGPGGTSPTALFTINVTGVPKTGDTIQVTTTQFPAANNGNAMAMLDLRDKNVISLDGGTTMSTATNAYSQMIGNLGVIVQGGQTAADISTTLKTNADQTLSSTSGVNLDEEAARLIQYQQAYQASAKVLQIAQSLFTTLLQVASG
jgi:flagellar hook-associated protein 1 FlgK